MSAANQARVTFLNVMHDAWCPGAHGDGAHCNCEPSFELHEDTGRFIKSVTQNRAQRRQAERAARAAIRKAARKGGR